MDGLLRYRTQSGMFRHTLDGEEDVMATEQAALALIAVQRLDAKENRLYDFTEIKVYEGKDDEIVTDTPAAKPIVWIVVGIVAALAAGGAAFVFIKRGKKKCMK